MKKSILPYILIVIIVFTALLAFTVFSGVNNSIGKVSFVFNLVFLILMFIIVSAFIILNVRKAIHIRNQFKDAIKGLETKEPQDISFDIKEINDAYENYKKETERLSQEGNGGIVCDIEEYIHPQLVNSIIQKSICETIAGSMTGLGLLGTFLGLIIGLKDFSTDYNEIQNSILMLLNGIKMSFLTSIYGVVFSLVFNRIYRGCYADTMNALDEFYQEFHKKVQFAQNDVNSRLITALECILIPEIKHTNEGVDKLSSCVEEKVAASIKTTMESIKKELSTHLDQTQRMQQESQESMVTSLKEHLQEVFSAQKEAQQSMVSSIESHLDQVASSQQLSLQSMVSRIESYLEKSETTQLDKLRAMVEQYLKTMNEEILNGELEELRKTLGMINESNSLHYQRVSELSAQIESSCHSLRELSKQYTENIGSFQNYVNAIQQYQSTITDSNTELVAHMSEMQKGYNAHNDTLTNLIDKMKELTTIVDNLDQICNQMDASLNADQKNRSEWTSAVTDLMHQLSFTIHSVSEAAIETMKADREAAESARNETTHQLEADLQLLKAFSQQCDLSSKELSAKYIEVTDRLNDGLETSFSVFDTETAKIIAYFNDLLIDIKDSADYIPIRLKQERKAEFEEWYKERQRMLDIVRGYRSQEDENELNASVDEESSNNEITEESNNQAVYN